MKRRIRQLFVNPSAIIVNSRLVNPAACYTQQRHPHVRGFSRWNLLRMRQFFEEYRERQKCQHCWHNCSPGRLRFLEVKGRVSSADTITVTRNEMFYSLKSRTTGATIGMEP